MGAARSPEEIRRSIEANRAELGMAVEKLRSEVAVVTDWRAQLAGEPEERPHRRGGHGLRARRRDRGGGRVAPPPALSPAPHPHIR